MCRAHRAIVAATVALWTATLALIFGVQPEAGPWRMMTYGLLGLSVVAVPYCCFPWLMRDMMAAQLDDVAGAFLAGWETAKAGDPDRPDEAPVPLRVVS